MARVFISHATKDRPTALQVHDWLIGHGFEKPFLSSHHEHGILPGQEWRRRLHDELAGCDALLALLSPDWNTSYWCFAEWTTASAVGAGTFPVTIVDTDPTVRPPHVTEIHQHQVVDWTNPDPRARASLLAAIRSLPRRPSATPGQSGGQTISQSGSGNIGVQTVDSTVTIMASPLPFSAPASIATPDLFVGRAAEMAEVRAALLGNGVRVVCSIRGMGGAGKTTLAREVARDLADQFSDGRIEIDMMGLATPPKRADDAAMEVIRRLYPTTPSMPDGAALDAYRATIGGKRFLVLLDNVADLGQFRPLILAAPVAILVTSRSPIRVGGREPLLVGAMLSTDAVELLIAEIGVGRATHEELEALAEACLRLPIALRAAGRLLAQSPSRTVKGYLDSLADQKRRLTELSGGDDPELDVRAVLTLSLNRLAASDPARLAAFQMLAVFPSSFELAAAAAVWATDEETARAALDNILRWSAIEYEAGRWRLHDLYRDLAKEGLSSAHRHEAEYRHSKHYAEVLKRASALYEKGGGGVLEGLISLDRERANIEIGQARAALRAKNGLEASKLVIDYADSSFQILGLRILPNARTPWYDAQLIAAQNIGDENQALNALGNRAVVLASVGQIDAARSAYQNALTYARRIGNRRSEGVSLSGLGKLALMQGKFAEALSYIDQDLNIAREIGDRRGEANTLGLRGMALGLSRQFDKAAAVYRLQLKIAQEIGDRFQEGRVTGDLGTMMWRRGNASLARAHYAAARAIAREIGDREGEANALGNLGNLERETGNPQNAIDRLTNALSIARERSDPAAESAALYNLALAWKDLGDRANAVDAARASLRIKRAIGEHYAKTVEAKLREWGVDPDAA